MLMKVNMTKVSSCNIENIGNKIENKSVEFHQIEKLVCIKGHYKNNEKIHTE